MRINTLVHGSDGEGGNVSQTREVEIFIEDNAIVLDLGRASGFANDPDAARIWIEWKPDRGWVAIMHANGDNPTGRVFLKDDGTALFEED